MLRVAAASTEPDNNLRGLPLMGKRPATTWDRVLFIDCYHKVFRPASIARQTVLHSYPTFLLPHDGLDVPATVLAMKATVFSVVGSRKVSLTSCYRNAIGSLVRYL
jgi:hypothetical protein